MSDGKQCLLYMVKIPYMEAGIVIMTDFSIVDIFWTAPFSKARAPGRKASREERKREREKEEEEGRHFPRVVIP